MVGRSVLNRLRFEIPAFVTRRFLTPSWVRAAILAPIRKRTKDQPSTVVQVKELLGWLFAKYGGITYSRMIKVQVVDENGNRKMRRTLAPVFTGLWIDPEKGKVVPDRWVLSFSDIDPQKHPDFKRDLIHVAARIRGMGEKLPWIVYHRAKVFLGHRASRVSISGIVKRASGESVAGATVTVEYARPELNLTAVTTSNGKFHIKIPPDRESYPYRLRAERDMLTGTATVTDEAADVRIVVGEQPKTADGSAS